MDVGGQLSPDRAPLSAEQDAEEASPSVQLARSPGLPTPFSYASGDGLQPEQQEQQANVSLLQQNVVNVFGDVNANIQSTVEMAEHNVMNMAEARHEEVLTQVMQSAAQQHEATVNVLAHEATVHLKSAHQRASAAEQQAEMLQRQMVAMQQSMHAKLTEINAAEQKLKQLELEMQEKERKAYVQGLTEGREVSTTANESVCQAPREGLLEDEFRAPRKGLPSSAVFQIGTPLSTPRAHSSKDNPYEGMFVRPHSENVSAPTMTAPMETQTVRVKQMVGMYTKGQGSASSAPGDFGATGSQGPGPGIPPPMPSPSSVPGDGSGSGGGGNGPPNGGPPDSGGNGPPGGGWHPPRKPTGKKKGSPDPDGDDDDPDGGDDSDWGSAHSGVSQAALLRRLAKSKYKEADEVKCLALPTAPAYRGWKNVFYQNVNTASGRPDDQALCWAREAEDESLPPEYFHTVPKKFATLSRKIAAVLQKVAEGNLGRNITQTAEDWIKQGKSVPGLVLLRIILQYYATGRQSDAVFNLNDLQKVQIKGGNLEGFQISWDMVLKGMRKPPEEDTLEFLYFEAVKDWRGLSEDIAHYRRLPEGSGGDRSYKFLYDSVGRCLQVARQQKIRDELTRALGSTTSSPALPAEKDKGKGKEKGKDKGKGKGKDKGKTRPSYATPPDAGKRPCHFFAKGKCTNGNECPFSHEAVKVKPGAKEECALFKQGRCTFGDKCKYSHGSQAAPAAADPKAKAKGKAKTPAVPCVISRRSPGDGLRTEPFTALGDEMLEGEAPGNGLPASPAPKRVRFDDAEQGAKPVCAASAGKRRMWLCDTGCPFDLASKQRLGKLKQFIEPAECTQYLDTANGRLEVSEAIHMQIPSLCENVCPLVLEDTPDVLTIGRRCVKQGFGFYWPPYSTEPFFEIPEERGGGICVLESIDDVPYLADDLNSPEWDGSPAAAPAPIATGCPTAEPQPEEADASSAQAPGNGMPETASPGKPEADEQEAPPLDALIQGKLERVQRRNLLKEALSLDHMMDHSKFNPYCRACVESKSQRTGHRKGAMAQSCDKPTRFGESTTGDHFLNKRKDNVVSSCTDEEDFFPGAKTAVVAYDRGTDWLGCFPKATRSTEDTLQAFKEFQGRDKIESFYCDNAGELGAAAKHLGWPMPTSTPGVPETNGLAERMVRKVKENTKCNLSQAGQHKSWWKYAAPCYCFTKNTEGENCAYFQRHGVESNHLRIPYGSLVDFMAVPNPNLDPGPFDRKTQPGIFVGYHQQPGGYFTGDYLVAEFEPFRMNPDAAPKDVKVHRTKEVIPPGRLEPITFPLAEYRLKMRSVPEAPPSFEHAEVPVLPDPRSESPPVDVRGQGGEVAGRKVRKYKGSSRPPDVDPDVWARIYTAKDKEQAIKAYLEKLKASGDRAPAQAPGDGMPSAPGDGQKACPATVAENVGDKLLNRIVVCRTHDGDEMATALASCDAAAVQVFGKNDVMEMTEAVKFPGVLLVFSVDRLGKASGRLLKKWDGIVKEATAWGGTVLLRMPAGSEEWNHFVLAKWVAMASLLEVKRPEDGNRLMTNNCHVRRALHGHKPAGTTKLVEKVWLAQAERAQQNQRALLHAFACGTPAVPATVGTVRTVAAPAMPVDYDIAPEHRCRVSEYDPLFPSAVARKVKRAEVEQVPAAKQAVDKEWFKLLDAPHPDGHGKGTWDMSSVREARDVRAEARSTNTTVHMGMIAELCFQKASELEDGDPLKVYKGRHVFLGDQVKDQDFDYAVFNDLGSAPPTMEAARALDALSCSAGYEQKQSDAHSAYTQSFLGGGRGKGVPTWVSIPRHRWPPEWVGKYQNPVVLLVLSLYGHPDAGGYWEAHCEKAVFECGWEKVQGWQSVYWHPECRALLVIYVDDFKMASKVADTAKLWAELQKRIKLDPPTDPDRFLGCYLEEFTAASEDVKFILKNHPSLHPRGQDKPNDLELKEPSRLVRRFKYNMQKYLESAVEKYCAVGDLERNKLKKVATPFVDEAQEPQGCVEQASSGKPEAGQLQKVAASILMTDMFAARLARNDLLRPVGHLATHIHDWSGECDRRLHRLMCYVNSSLEDRQIGFIGDPLEELWLAVYADADFAGDRKDSKSTAGAFLVLMGPNTFYPLASLSKKHGCTSHSTVEAEVVSLNTAIRTLGLPALDLWELILGRPVELVAYEDNQATAKIVQSGKYAAMRHVKRTHGVQLSFLTEQLKAGAYDLKDCHTHAMAADIFTKFFTCPRKWAHAIQLIGVCNSTELKQLSDRGSGSSGKPDAQPPPRTKSTGKPVAAVTATPYPSLCSSCGLTNSIHNITGTVACLRPCLKPASKSAVACAKPACPAPRAASMSPAPSEPTVEKASTRKRLREATEEGARVLKRVKIELAEDQLNTSGDLKICLRCGVTKVHRLKWACSECLPKGFTQSLQQVAPSTMKLEAAALQGHKAEDEPQPSTGKPVAGSSNLQPRRVVTIDNREGNSAASKTRPELKPFRKSVCDLKPAVLQKLKPIDIPAILIHETSWKHIFAIVDFGIQPTGNSADARGVLCEDVTARDNAQVRVHGDTELEVYIDAQTLSTKMVRKVAEAYRSLGGSIIFKDTVPFDMVKRIVSVKDGLTIYRAPPEDGHKLQIQHCECGRAHPEGAQFCFEPTCLEPFTKKAAHDRLRSLKGTEEFDEFKEEYLNESTAPGDRWPTRGTKGNRSRLSEADIKKRNKRAKKQGYEGHSDRWRRSPEYRCNCEKYDVPEKI